MLRKAQPARMGNDSQRRETCWRVVDADTGLVVVCDMYETAAPGWELRVRSSAARTLREEVLPDLEAARELAGQWLRTVRAAGSCVSLIVES